MSKKIAALDALRRFIDDDGGPLCDGDVSLVVEVRSRCNVRRMRYRDAKGRRRVFIRTIPNRPKTAAERRSQ